MLHQLISLKKQNHTECLNRHNMQWSSDAPNVKARHWGVPQVTVTYCSHHHRTQGTRGFGRGTKDWDLGLCSVDLVGCTNNIGGWKRSHWNWAWIWESGIQPCCGPWGPGATNNGRSEWNPLLLLTLRTTFTLVTSCCFCDTCKGRRQTEGTRWIPQSS